MKLIGNTLQKTFLVEHDGKTYSVSYINSDYSNLALINRENWEVVDEEGEELNIYFFRSNTKKEKVEIDLTVKKYNELIKFCIKNFDSYQPKIK